MARIDWQQLQLNPVNGSFLDSANNAMLGGVNTITKALLGYGSDIRDQNTNDALSKIAALSNLDDLAAGRSTIADAVAQQGRGVDQLKVLQALGAQQDVLTNRANAAINMNQNQIRLDEANREVADRPILNQAMQLSLQGKNAEAQALMGQIQGNASPLFSILQNDQRYDAQQARQARLDARDEDHWNKNYQLSLNADTRADLNTAASLAERLNPKAGETEAQAVWNEEKQDWDYTTKTYPSRMEAFGSMMNNLFSAESGPNQTHRTADGKLLRSPAGALGAAQIMPATAAKPGYGMKPINLETTTAEQQKQWATEYITRIGTAHNMTVPQAVAAYNAGPGAVQSAMKKASAKGGSGNFIDYLPQETKDYVPKILGNNWQSMSGTKMKDFAKGSPAATTPTKQTVAATSKISNALGGLPINAKVVAAAQNEYKVAASKLGGEALPESPLAAQKTMDQWLYDNRNDKKNSNSFTRLAKMTDADDIYNAAKENPEFNKLPSSKKVSLLNNALAYNKNNETLFKNPGDIKEKISEMILEDRKVTEAANNAKRTQLLDAAANKVLVAAGLPPGAVPKQALYNLFDPQWAKKHGKAQGKVDNPFQ